MKTNYQTIGGKPMGTKIFHRGLARDERGVAVVLALTVVLLVSVLAFGFITLTTTETQIAHNNSDYVRSLYVAEAGISECMFRLNYKKDAFIDLNGEQIYPYIPIFTVTDDRGTATPKDDKYWHNDRADNNGNGVVDEWAELDPAWSANVWFTRESEMPTKPANTATRKYNYYPTVLDLQFSNLPNLLRYSATTNEDFSLRIRYKKFPNGKIVFLDSTGEFEQPASYDEPGTPVLVLEASGRWERIQRSVRVEAVPRIKNIFDQGICGCDTVTLEGNTSTDSYNSDLGAYPAGLGKEGGVASNGDIVVDGSPLVGGDMVAMGFINAGNATVTGSALAGETITNGTIEGNIMENMGYIPQPCPCDVMDVADEVEYYKTHNDNDIIKDYNTGNPFKGSTWILSLRSDENLTLPAGTYYFDEINMGAQATITTLGKVNIYVAGAIRMTAAGFVNSTEDPSDLNIYCSGESIKIGGSSTFYGSIFAPESDIETVGGSDFYGAMVGKTVKKAGNTTFHFDEALGTESTRYYAHIQKISWKEIR